MENCSEKVIWEKEIAIWRGTCILYAKLVYTDCVKNIAMSIWWRVARASPRLQKQRAGTVAVMMGVSCVASSVTLLCACVDSVMTGVVNIQNTPFSNVKFWNHSVTEHSSKFWAACRVAWLAVLDATTIRKKMRSLLSGLKCESVITVWQNIFEEVVIFGYAMYSHRKEKYDMLIGTDLISLTTTKTKRGNSYWNMILGAIYAPRRTL